jgi:hypothetical protein
MSYQTIIANSPLKLSICSLEKIAQPQFPCVANLVKETIQPCVMAAEAAKNSRL